MRKNLKAYNILAIIVCILTISGGAWAENNLISFGPSKTYENLMKSFIMRSPMNYGYLYTESINEFRDIMVDTLVLTYIFSEIKAKRPIPEYLRDHFEISSEADVLSRITTALKKAKNKSNLNTIYRYSEVNLACLRMLQIAAQTLTEFAPYMNIKDKALKSTLAEGFGGVLAGLAGQVSLHESKHSENWKPALLTLQGMDKALTPPNFLQKIYEKINFSERLVVPQLETVVICRKLFQ